MTIPRATCLEWVKSEEDWNLGAGQMTVVALIISGMPSRVTVNRTKGVDASVAVERDVTDLPSIYIPPCTAQALSKRSEPQHS